MERITNNIFSKEQIVDKIKSDCPFRHPDLNIVCLGGSSSTNTDRERSDIDITTVMEPDNTQVVDINSIVALSRQINKFAFSLTSNFAPVVISTIRLEEAQVALAEVLFPKKNIIPIHWLHYPSFEFAKTNEPPELFEGLMSGNVLFGNKDSALEKFSSAEKCESVLGLDWLTDSLRILLSNISIDGGMSFQPVSFLKRHSMHNLEYFWKWNILGKLFQNTTGEKLRSWNDLESIKNTLPADLWNTANKVRVIRHQGAKADLNDIISLHAFTFNLFSK